MATEFIQAVRDNEDVEGSPVARARKAILLAVNSTLDKVEVEWEYEGLSSTLSHVEVNFTFKDDGDRSVAARVGLKYSCQTSPNE
jgi:hypothetical protein